MRRRAGWRRTAGWLLVALGVSSTALSGAGAQSIQLVISGLASDSTSPAPAMTITASENKPQFGPYSVSLELSLESQFRTPFFASTAEAEQASFTIDSLLPARTMIYYRVRLSDEFGDIVAEARYQYAVRSWLRLISVGQPTTRTPQFNWSSPPLTAPPGPWVYDLTVINSATGKPDFVAEDLQDTSYVFPQPLESSTSYRWEVNARAQSGVAADDVTVASGATFVISSPDQPTVTLFYQNFPNPFGRATRSERTCFWFDLAHTSNVTLIIYDITLREVRRLIPGAFGSGQQVPVGAYGRNSAVRCVDELTWDGRDDTGRTVPAGVYLAVFKGDGVRTSVKALYKGP